MQRDADRSAGDRPQSPSESRLRGLPTVPFDTALDRDVADDGNAVGAAAAYRRIFLAAVRDRPLAYAGKFVRQMAYGASVAWPPYGLEPAIPVSTDDVPHVSDIMTRHGRAAQPIDLQGGPVRIGLLADLPGLAYLLALSSFVSPSILTVTACVGAPGSRRAQVS